MQGYPEFSFTTVVQPDAWESIEDLSEAETARIAGAVQGFTAVAQFEDSILGGVFLAGYLAAVNRLPIFIIDPADMLGKETD